MAGMPPRDRNRPQTQVVGLLTGSPRIGENQAANRRGKKIDVCWLFPHGV
jgi:hypothetical protein